MWQLLTDDQRAADGDGGRHSQLALPQIPAVSHAQCAMSGGLQVIAALTGPSSPQLMLSRLAAMENDDFLSANVNSPAAAAVFFLVGSDLWGITSSDGRFTFMSNKFGPKT